MSSFGANLRRRSKTYIWRRARQCYIPAVYNHIVFLCCFFGLAPFFPAPKRRNSRRGFETSCNLTSESTFSPSKYTFVCRIRIYIYICVFNTWVIVSVRKINAKPQIFKPTARYIAPVSRCKILTFCQSRSDSFAAPLGPSIAIE